MLLSSRGSLPPGHPVPTRGRAPLERVSLPWMLVALVAVAILAWLCRHAALHWGAGSKIWACGNVTLLGPLLRGERQALPKRVGDVLRAMLAVSQMRGAQSGGGAIQIAQGSVARQVIAKYVNPKRADLASRLTRKLQGAVGSKPAWAGNYLVQTHVRYATAGMTTREEAHPFRYVDVSARGLRRVTRWVNGRPQVELRAIETALTHNGDMDGLRFRGVAIEYPELGAFLEHVLGVPNRWHGDSPQLAAAIELFLTRGMWRESLRLAFYLSMAPPPPNFSALPRVGSSAERRREVARALGSYPRLSDSELANWEATLEHLLHQVVSSFATPVGPEQRVFRQRLIEAVQQYFASTTHPLLASERVPAFTRALVSAFFDNDLYIAVRRLEPGLLGTFGCVVSSTLEPSSVVCFARGQPLSLGFDRETNMLAIASERAALKVRSSAGLAMFDKRLDLDLCGGEIARATVDEGGELRFTLYGINEGREYGSSDLERAGRLIPLEDNPYITPLPLAASDRARADLESLGPLLAKIQADWRDPRSLNLQTASALASALLSRAEPRLLLLGITNDLWLAEQFVLNLKHVLPGLRAEAVSSNQVLLQGDRFKLDRDTIVLAISQTGQDFPTLGALLHLMAMTHASGGVRDNFYALSGDFDTLMAQALGQSFAREARFCARAFSTLTGFRPSEASLSTISATHFTLDQLLLALAQAVQSTATPNPKLALALNAAELHWLTLRGEESASSVVPRSVELAAARGSELPLVVRRWRWHVLEGIVAFGLLVCVLELNLAIGVGLVPSGASRWLPSDGIWTWSRPLLAQLDVLFYAFFAPLCVWLLRLLQGRALFHRQGLREVLIADVPFVHRIVWLLSRKLFSLSYGFASIKPYAADPQDDLILTHEPVRGTLVLLGLPEAYAEVTSRRRSAALMSAKQFSYSRSAFGSGAEIVTLGPTAPSLDAQLGVHLELPTAHVPLPSPRLEELVEGMFDAWARLVGMQVLLESVARRVSALALFRYDRSRTKDEVYAPTTAAPVSAAAVYQRLSRSTERYEHSDPESLPFEVLRSDWRPSAPKARTTVWSVNSEQDLKAH
ncbi:MAG TPA: hypothetical protein VHM70_32575 [Polyangiaceae bacterium]|nr:hypothetical protein [Polyangiaceae bacterium]